MADPQDGPGRSETFIKALTSPSEELKKETVQVADFRECPSDESIKEAIFVVHGIRDPGYWTQKIARRVAKLAGKDRPFAMVTSSYGYFPMAPFLVASSRRKKVEWLMDQYAEAKARYPNAKFSCVAHSNGTYLIAKALELYPACRFRRIVFAGSVLRQSFKWRPFFEPKNDPRVLAVTNYVATGDWVVAFFPKFFQFLHWQDLGSAGHDGFDDDPDGAVYDQRYVQGGHSAALDERNWDAIARFIVTGERPVVPEKLRGEKPVPWIRWAGIFPPAVWILLIGIVAVMGYYLNRAGGAALLVIYLLLIWKVLTRI
jgi:pimeloyl-ACP methyl ester carboxylesterase